ncbi:MAG: YggU family protein [Nitrospirae bacterium]|nr:MAG: YggU family protein [Nitrospirota bacterium]
MEKLTLRDIPYKKGKGGIIIQVKVEPRSSRTEVAGVHGEALKVKLTAPPVEGKANKQLIEVLADHFNIKKRDVEVLRGETGRLKTILLKGIGD